MVVCQHGLEGRPQSTTGEKDHHYYKAFATELANLGFVTFAPQNIYIFQDRFRSLQFKANAIGKTLFSIMVPQHQQITNWLGSLEFIDEDRIGFYGLSYGGKSAMRIPPLVDNYCLSICSADFNEWVWKNASTISRYSYVWTGEYEIFEWDLGSTFNYFEMAALIAPRPFMVERGHFDGVAPDETVAHEYAKVRNLYSAKLGIGNKQKLSGSLDLIQLTVRALLIFFPSTLIGQLKNNYSRKISLFFLRTYLPLGKFIFAGFFSLSNLRIRSTSALPTSETE